MRIGIAGIAGRMGRVLAEEVRQVAELAGGTERAEAAAGVPAGVTLFPEMAGLAAVSDVVLDFTHATAARDHAQALARTGTAWVLGTTGLSAADQEAVVAASARSAIVQAPNFAPGVNLMLALAERMAAALPAENYDVEILEMHHRQKVDAPSGTALGLGRAVARGRGVALEGLMESGRHGQTGARKLGAIGFAALRGGQIVGEHTVIFAAADEQIALSHRAFDRRAFAAGAIRAALWIAGRPPGLYSMMDVLGIGAPVGRASA